jgi:hypothetical protein
MLTSLEEMQAALAGTPLADGALEELGPEMFVLYLHPDMRPLDSWRTARDLMPVTGRRPVLAPDLEDLSDPTTEEFEAFSAAVRRTSPWEVWRDRYFDGPVDRDELEGMQRNDTLRAVAVEAAEAIDFPVSLRVLDRWLYERIRLDSTVLKSLEGRRCFPNPWSPFGGWVENQIVFLPTVEPHAIATWFSYFPADTPEGQVGLGAVLDEWSQRWGAEVAATAGTLMLMDVQHRPSSGGDAWEAAQQIRRMAGSVQFHAWHLALLVERCDTWVLHDRP